MILIDYGRLKKKFNELNHSHDTLLTRLLDSHQTIMLFINHIILNNDLPHNKLVT